MLARVKRTVINGVLMVTVAAVAGGCSKADDTSDTGVGAAPLPPTTTATPTRSPGPVSARPPTHSTPPGPTATGFSEFITVPCAGRPDAPTVLALLRHASVLPAGTTPTATTGPMCSGTWQYTMFALRDRDPLYAVTQGPPGALRLVTAGTNPCTATVRGAAPPGILAALDC